MSLYQPFETMSTHIGEIGPERGNEEGSLLWQILILKRVKMMGSTYAGLIDFTISINQSKM
jgi:hypothetical protein